MPTDAFATLALCALPAILGLGIAPIAARVLAVAVRPQAWMLVVAGWAIVSSVAFGIWFRRGLDAEIAAHVAGPMRESGLFLILGFVFWNGVLILAANLGACAVGAVLRRRRRRASPATAA